MSHREIIKLAMDDFYNRKLYEEINGEEQGGQWCPACKASYRVGRIVPAGDPTLQNWTPTILNVKVSFCPTCGHDFRRPEIIPGAINKRRQLSQEGQRLRELLPGPPQEPKGKGGPRLNAGRKPGSKNKPKEGPELPGQPAAVANRVRIHKPGRIEPDEEYTQSELAVVMGPNPQRSELKIKYARENGQLAFNKGPHRGTHAFTIKGSDAIEWLGGQPEEIPYEKLYNLPVSA